MKKVTQFGLEVFWQVKFYLFDLNLSMKPVKKFFLYKKLMQIKSYVTLFSLHVYK